MKKPTTKKMILFIVIALVIVIAAVTVIAVLCSKKAVGIEVSAEPTKTTYTVGDTFDPSGMIVSVLYSNDTSEEIQDYTYDLTGSLKVSDNVVTIFYEDFTAEVSIKVYNPLTGISIQTHATKTEYKSGEVFNPEGMVLSLTYKDGSNKSLNVEDAEGFSFDNTRLKVGVTEVSVSYSGFIVNETINVTRGSIIETSIDNDFVSAKENVIKLIGGKDGVETDGAVYANGRIGSLDKADKYVKYTFKLAEDGKVDFVWNVAGNHWVNNVGNGGAGNGGVADLQTVAELTVDNFEIDVAGIELPRGEDKNSTEEGYDKAKDYWNLQKFIIKDLELSAGEHTFLVKLLSGGLNVDSLVLYSDSNFDDGILKAVIDESFESAKENKITLVGGDNGVETNGNVYTSNGKIGSLDKADKYVKYTFTLAADGKVDLVWKVAGNHWHASAGGEGVAGNIGVSDLGNIATVTIDGETVDVAGIALIPDTYTNYWYIHTVVIKDLNLSAGTHTFEIKLSGPGLNVESLDICSNTTVVGVATE